MLSVFYKPVQRWSNLFVSRNLTQQVRRILLSIGDGAFSLCARLASIILGTNLGGGWTALQSASLTNGSFYFSDAQWANYPNRFYRIRSP
jgi:hypothetical protein